MEEHWTVVIFTFVLGSKFTDKIFLKIGSLILTVQVSNHLTQLR